MIKYTIPQDLLDTISKNNNKSITSNRYGSKHTKADTTYLGLVGECVFNYVYGNELSAVDYGTDIYINDKKCDIKCQSFNYGSPQGHWAVNYSARQANLSKDDELLLFSFYNPTTREFVFAGWDYRDDYLQDAKLTYRGQQFYYNPKNTATTETYEMQIKDLLPFDDSKFVNRL